MTRNKSKCLATTMAIGGTSSSSSSNAAASPLTGTSAAMINGYTGTFRCSSADNNDAPQQQRAQPQQQLQLPPPQPQRTTTATIAQLNNTADQLDNTMSYKSERPPRTSVIDADGLLEVKSFLERRHSIHLAEIIGSGTFADVYRGENRRARKHVAVKIIDLFRTSAHYRETLLPSELAIVRAMQHPRIVRMYQLMQIAGRVIMVMEFAAHGTMSDMVCRVGALTEPSAWRVFRETISAVAYMHSCSIAHRDLKLENILINHQWIPKLADFSFATYFAEDCGAGPTAASSSATPTTPTSPNYQPSPLCINVCGSVPYFAPELLAHLPYNPLLSDVWAIGVCLYIMSNDTFPFRLGNDAAMLEAARTRSWKLRPRTELLYGSSYKALLRRMLEPEVAKRIRAEEIESHEWLITEKIED